MTVERSERDRVPTDMFREQIPLAAKEMCRERGRIPAPPIPSTPLRVATLIAVIAAVLGLPNAAAPFMLKKRDRVAFLGDSNTHVVYGYSILRSVMHYTEITEAYTTLHAPDLKVRFTNRAVAGSSALDVLNRLDDVLAEQPTVIVVTVGILDVIGAQQDPKTAINRFAMALSAIVDRASQQGVRVIVCSYPVVSNDPVAHFTARQQFLDMLGALGAKANEIVSAAGGTYIDLLGETHVLAAQAVPENVGDGLHMNDLGQAVTGYAMLKGLGATTEDNLDTAQITVGQTATVSFAHRASVDRPTWDAGAERLTFNREDKGLPLTVWRLDRRSVTLGVVPFTSTMSFENLVVSGLPPNDIFTVRADGRTLAQVSGSTLAAGVNLAMSAGGPNQSLPGGHGTLRR